jgi:hypothetical protein
MNHWFFWVLAPVMLATGLGLPFLAEPPTWQGRVILFFVCGALVLATLGLARPRRFRWALRAVAGAIFLICVMYAVSEAIVWWQGKPFGLETQQAESNLYNALSALAAFGLPSIYFILRGRSGKSVDVLLDVDGESNGRSSPAAQNAFDQGDREIG